MNRKNLGKEEAEGCESSCEEKRKERKRVGKNVFTQLKFKGEKYFGKINIIESVGTTKKGL